MKIQLIATVFALSTSFAMAEPGSTDRIILDNIQALGLIEKVQLVVMDGVDEGCWTNVTAVKHSIRLKLEQSGIAVEDTDLGIAPTVASLHIFGHGSRSGGICYGSIAGTAVRNAWIDYERVSLGAPLLLFVKSAPAISTTNLNGNFKETAVDIATEFAADILKYRRDPIVQEAKAALR